MEPNDAPKCSHLDHRGLKHSIDEVEVRSDISLQQEEGQQEEQQEQEELVDQQGSGKQNWSSNEQAYFLWQ